MKRAVIFGAGVNGEKVFNNYKNQYNIIGFFDNNSAKQNTVFCGKEVYAPFSNKFKNEISDNDFCIIISFYDISYSIIEQLKSFDIENDVYWFNDDALYRVYPNNENLIRCNRCVMDNFSDPTITFDENGYCDYCSTQLKRKDEVYFPNEIGEKKLQELIKTVKEENKNNKYDCLIGVSGGLDSSYLTYLANKWGLRAICIQIDDGFYTDISKNNIDKLIKATGFKFIPIIPDEKQYNALTKAYLKAGVPNISAPQDNVLVASLFKFAKEHNIRYFFSGNNFALESIAQRGEVINTTLDIDNMKNIHSKFGTEPIDRLDLTSPSEVSRLIAEFGIEIITPLNFIDYNRDRAFKELHNFCNFEYYGGKHLENILTAFYILYWCPKKFGVDFRVNYLSSMIVSGQLEREEALRLLEEPLYDENIMAGYISVIKAKLNISDDEFEDIMASETKHHLDYDVVQCSHCKNASANK